MSFFQFLRDQVSNVTSGIGQQQQIVTGVMQQITGFVPKVQAAWVGGDANEFAADVGRKLIPAIQNVIAAIAGISTNIQKATDVVDQADAKVKGLVSGLEDMFKAI